MASNVGKLPSISFKPNVCSEVSMFNSEPTEQGCSKPVQLSVLVREHRGPLHDSEISLMSSEASRQSLDTIKHAASLNFLQEFLAPPALIFRLAGANLHSFDSNLQQNQSGPERSNGQDSLKVKAKKPKRRRYSPAASASPWCRDQPR